VGSGCKLHVGAAQRDQLCDSESGLDCDQQQGVVTSADPGGAVRAFQQRLGLLAGQERDQGAVVALLRDRQDTLDGPGVLGVVQRGEPEQGVDRRQPGVAGPRAVAPRALQVLQERGDQGGVQVGQVELGRRGGGLARDEVQQQPEGIPVGSHGLGAGLALGGETLGEERLEGGGQQAHCGPPGVVWRRWPASVRSSGAAWRYQ
jgi:hypothetical protein